MNFMWKFSIKDNLPIIFAIGLTENELKKSLNQNIYQWENISKIIISYCGITETIPKCYFDLENDAQDYGFYGWDENIDEECIKLSTLDDYKKEFVCQCVTDMRNWKMDKKQCMKCTLTLF